MERVLLVSMGLSLFLTSCTGRNENQNSLLWINGTYAVLTASNGGNLSQFGGMARNAANTTTIRQALSNSWGVNSREELSETIDALVNELHNQRFLQEIQRYDGITTMSQTQFEAALSRVANRGTAMHIRNMYEAYQAFGEKAILGWDLSRATQLAAWGYIAEFYTYEEAVDRALSISRIIQSQFNSWDDFYASYLYGFAWWSEADIEDPQSNYSRRVNIFNELKSDPQSPLNLNWNLNLVR